MSKIKIEYFCPELSHFYGDHGNLLYLEKKAELMGNSVEIIRTAKCDRPQFINDSIDLLYIGPTTEKGQIDMLAALKEYRDDLWEAIEKGQYILMTGNSLELLYQSITMTDMSIVNGLDFFPLQAERFAGKRYSVNVIAEYENRKIAGYKNLQSKTIATENSYPLFRTIKEKGELVNNQWEGIHYKNLYATYLIGPVLLQNPYFSNKLLQDLFGESYQEVYLPFEIEAHQKRINDVMNDKNPDKNG